MESIKNIKQYPVTIICFVLIIYLSFMNASGISTPGFLSFKRSDLVIHFMMYTFLSFVFFTERYNNLSENKKNIPWFIFITLIVIGGTIEILQPIISKRSCDLFDFIANNSGVFAGYLLHRITINIWFLKKIITYK